MVTRAEVVESGILDFEVFPVGKNSIFSGTGGNQRGLLVALAGEQRPELTVFLEKIFQAVGYDLETDAVSHWVTSEAPLWLKEPLQTGGTPIRHAVFFGILPAQVGLQLVFKTYQPFTANHVTFLFADPLDKILENPALKRPLWEGLKVMFK